MVFSKIPFVLLSITKVTPNLTKTPPFCFTYLYVKSSKIAILHNGDKEVCSSSSSAVNKVAYHRTAGFTKRYLV